MKLLDDNSTSIFIDDDIIGHYKTRSPNFKHLSLAEFASDYNVYKTKDTSILNIVKRTSRKIIRYVKYNKKPDLYNYQRSLVMLFHPLEQQEVTNPVKS